MALCALGGDPNVCPICGETRDPDWGHTCKSTEKTMTTKDTNPKDAVGTKKWRQYCTVPTTIIWELGVAMLEGARKYGRHNYRVAGVRASVYIDAAKGHIDQWWEGEDIDIESGLSHITKAMASLAVLRDAMINDMVNDDRPPKANLDRVRTEMQKAVEGIFERFPDAVEPFTELGLRRQDPHMSGYVDVDVPAGPHTISVNGNFFKRDGGIVNLDELAKLAGFNIPNSDLHRLVVMMRGRDEIEPAVTHGNAFTAYDGTVFDVTCPTPSQRIERGLDEKSLEDRRDDLSDGSVRDEKTFDRVVGYSEGYEGARREEGARIPEFDAMQDALEKSRDSDVLAGVDGHKEDTATRKHLHREPTRIPRGARGQGGGI